MAPSSPSGSRPASTSRWATSSWSSADGGPGGRGRDGAGDHAGGRGVACPLARDDEGEGGRRLSRATRDASPRPPRSRSRTSTRPASTGDLDPATDLGLPGEYPFTRGVQATMYRSPVLDDAPVRGLRHGGRDQRALPLPPDPGPDRPVGRLRPADPDGLRLGRPGGRGRGRPGRRPDLEPRGHGDPVRRDPAGRGQHLDDDQRDGADPARPLRRGGGEAGRRRASAVSGTAQNDILKEYIARGTWIYPPRAVHAPRHRRVRVREPRAAEVEHDLDLRLPHARGRGHRRPGARLHPRRRDRVRRGGRRAGASPSTTSPPGCRSSSRPGRSCSRRSPSSGPPAGCGPGSCRSGSGPGTRSR